MQFNSNNYEEKKSSTVFPLGESISGVTISNIKYATPEECRNKNGGIDITYKKDDTELRDRRFIPDLDNVQPRDGETMKDAQERTFRMFNSVLHHIASKFSTTEINGTSIVDYAKKWCTAMLNDCSGNKFYLKTVLNNNGYVNVPKYPNFIQNMASGESELTYTEKQKEENAENDKVRKERMSMSSANLTPSATASSSSAWA